MLKRIVLMSGLVTSLLLIPNPFVTLAATDTVAQANRQGRPSIFTSLFNILTRSPVPRRRGGGRGDLIVLTPGAWGTQATNVQPIWNLQPLLIWQNSGRLAYPPSRVEIISNDGQIVFNQPFTQGEFVTLSVQQQLQPGQSYRLRFLRWNDNEKKEIDVITPIPFRVMTNAERQQVTQSLNQVEASLKKRRASANEILLARVEVFVNNQLWSDALQEIQSSNLSIAQRQELIQEVVQQWQNLRRKSRYKEGRSYQKSPQNLPKVTAKNVN